MKTLVWAALIIGGIYLYTNRTSGGLTQEELLNNKAKLSAELATVKPEGTVLPNITPDNNVPPLNECNLCDGTGYITHADGHKTPCPYHGSQMQIQELQEAVNDLTDRVSVHKKYGEDLYAYLMDQREKQKLLIRPEPQKAPVPDKQLKATFCPCGCKHNVANCTCRASCPGKRLPAYTYTTQKPVVQQRQETTVRTPLTPFSPEMAPRTTTTYYNTPQRTTFKSRTKSCGIFGCSSRSRGFSRWRS